VASFFYPDLLGVTLAELIKYSRRQEQRSTGHPLQSNKKKCLVLLHSFHSCIIHHGRVCQTLRSDSEHHGTLQVPESIVRQGRRPVETLRIRFTARQEFGMSIVYNGNLLAFLTLQWRHRY
jgi:hypothetical protein